MVLDIQYYLLPKNVMQFIIGLIYIISETRGITYSINYSFARIRIDSYNSLYKVLYIVTL